MINITRQIGLEAETPVKAPTTAIHAGPRSGGPAAMPPAPPYHQPFANPQLNSRLPVPLPHGKWSVAWSTELLPRQTPGYVLDTGSRIIVQAGIWQLYHAADGKLIAKAGLGQSGMTVGPEGLFLGADNAGNISGYRLSDGQRAFALSPSFGEAFRRTYLGVSGNRVLILGVEQPMDPHGQQAPERSVLDAQDVLEPLRVSASGLLQSVEDKGRLHIVSTIAMAAVSAKKTLFLAVPGRLYHGGTDLAMAGAVEGDFVPLAMSLDDADRACLIVRSEGKTRLWIVGPDGTRSADAEVPGALPATVAPPAIGFDGRMYLQASGRILAYNVAGRPVWEYAAPGLAGLSVTDDNIVLASDGNTVVAIAADGKAEPLCDFDQKLVTPPVLTGDGSLLVASGSRLYCARAK